MPNWREELRSQGFHIDDEPRTKPRLPSRRNANLATWTVAWKREPALDGFLETIVLPPGYEWDTATRSGVHEDRRYMTRFVKAPGDTVGNTIFRGCGEDYMNHWWFEKHQWIVEV